jgi:hypothetical protein
LSTTKLRKEFFMPLLLSAQRRLSSCSIYLNYGDMLRIINFVLSLIAHLLFEHFESLCLGPKSLTNIENIVFGERGILRRIVFLWRSGISLSS